MQIRICTLKLNLKNAQSVFDKLSRAYRIVAPVEKPGAGAFSQMSLVTYDEVSSFSEIVFGKQTFFSAKYEAFPIRETLFTIDKGTLNERPLEMRPTIIFLRSCDIHAMQVIDTHFLKDSQRQDYYYKRRRERIKFFLIECPQSFENCYCVSMGTNKTDDYSVFMRRTKEGYEVEAKDVEFGDFLPKRADLIEGPRFAKENHRNVTIPQSIPASIFEDDIWKEYSKRCIACGRCNTSCPTCTCFTVQDIADTEPAIIERRRIWSSCHVNKFSLLAGGHDFRESYKDRMRYRVLHKINDFKRRNGRQMCVGCGRCDDVCPEYISMFRCVDKINEVLKDVKYRG